MSDAELDLLGRLAREALTTARHATLLIAEVGTVDCEVVLFEVDGRPQFACAADSPVAAATGSEAQLHVPLGCARGGGTVELSGRLVLAAYDDGEAIVELGIESVSVQKGHHAVPCSVPVDVYLASAGDPLTEFAARLVAHTNESHAQELRALAARRLGLFPATIAAASIAELDATGVDLHWIDADGFHLSRLAFPYPAADPQHLSALLRDQLQARPSHTNNRGDS